MAFSQAQAYIDSAKKRRSHYAITDTDLPLTGKEVESIVQQLLVDCPSPWNVCSSRVVVVLGDQHKALFNDVIYPTIKNSTPAEQFVPIEGRLTAFAAGAGTILFFEDQNALQELKQSRPFAASIVPEYSDESSGMLQYAVWTTLSVAGLGASLQHLQARPGVEAAIRQRLDIPAAWVLKAELVLGKPTKEVGERMWSPSAPLEERLKVFA